MKRAAGFVLCLMLAMCISLPSAFASTNFELPELKMTVDVPDGFMVFTRDLPESDPGYATLGLTKPDVDSMLNKNNEYLHAIQPDFSTEIGISMTPDNSNVFDYNLLSGSELDSVIEKSLEISKTEYPDSEITGHSIYKHGQAIYDCVDYKLPADGVDYYYRGYDTVINGMIIQIKMSSYEPATQEQQDMLKQVVDSIQFTEVLKKPFAVSRYWWVIIAIAALLMVALRTAKQKRKAKDAKNSEKYNGRSL